MQQQDSEQLSVEDKLEESLRREHLTEGLEIKQIEQDISEVRLGSWEEIHPISVIIPNENPIQLSIRLLGIILNLGQDLAKFFSSKEDQMNRAIQLTKLSVIGMMQLQQINLIKEGKPPSSKSINAEYDIVGTEFNEVSLNCLLNHLNVHILPQLQQIGQELFKGQPKQLLRQLVIYLSKLQACLELIPYAYSVPRDDLFSLDRHHPRWETLNECVQFKILGSKVQLQKAYDKLLEGILLANAMISKGSEYDGQFMQSMMSGFGAVFYMFQSKKAKSRAHHFMAEPREDLAFKAWNLTEQGMLKQLMKLVFPSISYNTKVYLPRLFQSITKESILDQYKNNTINCINNDVGHAIHNEQLPTHEQLYKKQENLICVRILCHQQPKLTTEPTMMQQFAQYFQTNGEFSKIIIHIHGGGFVSMSSRSHQTYTRKWANKLKVPIFSVDYRIAPDHPYPCGLEDCWQAYMFILAYIQNYFHIVPNKVALVGDSAGGNLVGALTVQCIKAGVRVPDGILMAYPALNLTARQFTPSFLVALDDGLLHHTFLRLCIKSYLTAEFDAKIDPLICPSFASDDILSRFPITRIVAGTNDPLHDESWRLVERLHLLKKDVKMIIYEGMPHGFLSFDVPQGMKEAGVTVQDAASILSELIQ